VLDLQEGLSAEMNDATETIVATPLKIARSFVKAVG
jgi:hypothetical protein